MTQPVDDITPAPAPAGRPVNVLSLLLMIGAIALAIGSLTPWVTVFGIGISGTSVHYGIVSLVTAGVLGVLAYLATRDVSLRTWRVTAGLGLLGALLSLASTLYVGWAVRSSYAESSGDDLADSFASAFRPGLGFGLWLVLVASAAAVVATLPMVVQRELRSPAVLTPLILIAVLAVGGTIAVDRDAKADAKREVAAAKAKEAAEKKAEEDAEAARVAAEQAAEEEAAADRQRYTVMLTSCTQDGYGGSDVKGTLVNEGTLPHSYEIHVPLVGADGASVDDVTSYLSDVPAGSTAAWDGFGYGEAAKRCGEPTVEVSEY